MKQEPEQRSLSKTSRARMKIYILGLFVALGAWGFIALAEEVAEEETAHLDEAVLLELRVPGDTSDPLGPIWVEEAARDITALGSVAILVMISFAATVFLALTGKSRTSILFGLSAASGVALSQGLKGIFDRARPDLVAHQMHTLTASFPSGHSLLSALIYLSLGALLASSQPRIIVKIFIYTSCGLVVILVGLSRLYLGVHWPTDVLAGWCVGLSWALLWNIIAHCFLPAKEHEESGLEPLESNPSSPKNKPHQSNA